MSDQPKLRDELKDVDKNKKAGIGDGLDVGGDFAEGVPDDQSQNPRRRRFEDLYSGEGGGQPDTQSVDSSDQTTN
jgi:hypothetical protein